MASYAATKHAIEGYSESVDHEVREHGIRVLLVVLCECLTPACCRDRLQGTQEENSARALVSRQHYLRNARRSPLARASRSWRRRTVSPMSHNIGGQSPTKIARRSALPRASSPMVLARIQSVMHSAIEASEVA